MSSVLLLLFVGSGAAALIYEIVWFQLLELFIGSSAVSIGVLLGTFMGGMCLGSLLFSRVVAPDRHALRVYAALELGIGACGVSLLFVMPLVGRLYTASGVGGLGGFLLRGGVAALCLLPPTVAMGATLPAIARWVEATPDRVGKLGLFYAGNIAGGVFGTLVAAFYLLRVHDMWFTTLVAVAINLLVAAVAFVLANRVEAPGGTVVSAPVRADARARTVYVAIGLSGFCALAGEVIWTRLLGLLFGATIYALSLIVAVFLIGLGCGSTAASLAPHGTRSRDAFGWCQLLLVGAVAWTAHEVSASLPFWPVNPALSSRMTLTFKLDFVRALWAVLPSAVLWGASFPLALAAAAREREDPAALVGRVYAANTFGAVAGALITSLFLIPSFGSQAAQRTVMVLSALAGMLMLLPLENGTVRLQPAVGVAQRGRERVKEREPRVIAALVVAIVAVGFLVRSVPAVSPMLVAHGRFAAALNGQSGPIIYVGEGLQSSVAVSKLPNGQLAYHNAGKIQASSAPEDMRLQRMLGHLTTLVPTAPRTVLVIGCGAGVTAGAVSVDPLVDRVTIAEIEPLVPKVVSTYFGPQNHHVVDNPKVRIRIDDARHFVLTTREKFDAITSDPLDPWVKGAATLYTKEFFEAVRDRLQPGGVVTLFVQLYDSTPAAIKSEIATFFDVFPGGIIAGNTFRGIGYDTVLLGEAGPTRIDLDAIEARLRRPDYAAVRASLREVGIGSAVDLFATYAGRASDLSPWMADASINRDRDLRLQYLAGLGLNTNESDAVYADILRYRRFPADLFVGSDHVIDDLRSRIGGQK